MLLIFSTLMSSLFTVAFLAIAVHSFIYGMDGLAIRRLSYRSGDDVGLTGLYDPPWFLDSAGFSLRLVHARLQIGYSRSFAADNGDLHPHRHSDYSFDGWWAYPLSASAPWFEYYHAGGAPFDDPRAGTVAIILPAPVAVLPGLILPVVFIYRWTRGKKGVCESCGYDTRATPNRCPECGTAAHASKKRYLLE